LSNQSGDYEQQQQPDHQPEYKAPSQIHEQVVKTLRKEKDTMARAFSNEKNRRLAAEEDKD